MQTSMSVHQIPVSMGAHAWTASTAIGACVPQVGAGLTVSWTRTSAAVVPVWMPTPARIFREDTSVTVRLDGQGRTATSVGVLTYILILKPKTTFFQKCNEIYITQDCKIAILWCNFSLIFQMYTVDQIEAISQNCDTILICGSQFMLTGSHENIAVDDTLW